jgi:hypothetical protein
MNAALQIAFFTGQSRPTSCALSPQQRTFLDRLVAASGAVPVDLNFPYVMKTPPWQPTPLLRASVNNARQFLQARRGSFRALHRNSVIALVARATRTVFLSGSCGLELLRRLELPAQTLGRIAFVAYGPVTKSRPACEGVVVQGRRDWISRAFSSCRPDRRVACGHLDYLADETFARICADFVASQSEPSRRTHAVAAAF